MHAQLAEAQKRLQVAKDHYLSALDAIEGQCVKVVVAAGVDAKAVNAIRAQYYAFTGAAVLYPTTPAPEGGTTRGRASVGVTTRRRGSAS